eukprot:Em0106g12a
MDDDSVPIPPYTECVATDQYIKEYPDELSFGIGDVLIILEPSEVRYWYIAENANHERGIVPVTFLKPRKPPIPPKSKPVTSISPLTLLSSCIPDSHTNPSSTQDLFHNGLVIPSDHHNLVPNANTTGLTQPTLHCSAAMKELPPDIGTIQISFYTIQNSSYTIQSSFYTIQNSSYTIQSSFYTIQSSFYTIQNSSYTIQSSFYTIQSSFYTIQSSFYTIQSSFYTIQSSSYTIQSSFYTIQSSSYTIQSSFYTIQSSFYTIQSSFYTIQSSFYTIQNSSYTIQSSLYTIQSSFYTIQNSSYTIQIHTPKQYSSVEDFRAKSGWFRPSVERVLMDKLQLSLQAFTGFTQGTYFFQHKWEPNLKYVGWSHDIHCELIQLFQGLYDKSEVSLNPLEAALRFRQPDAPSWSIRAWRVENTEELDMEAVS